MPVRNAWDSNRYRKIKENENLKLFEIQKFKSCRDVFST